jgi:uncharacterized protein (DUF58 family)
VTGRPTLVLAAAFVLAGAAFDSPSLYVPGVALALLAAGSWLWVKLAARGLRIEHEPGPRSIVEGDAYPVDIRIHAGALPLPGARAVHPLVTRPAPVGMRSRRVYLEVPSLRRGRRGVEPSVVRLSDPMGLHTAEIEDARGDQVLVLPRVEPVVWRGESNGAPSSSIDGVDGVALTGLDARTVDLELDGLRPYRPGSSASRIHWPTLARIGEVLEHRLVPGAGSSPLVVLDSSAPVAADDLDKAVRAAASLCMHLARSGGCELLLSGERRPLEIDPQLRTWPRAHARLAVVEPGESRPAIGPAAVGGGVFWVTADASVANGERPPARSRGYLVTPFRLPGLAPTFSVAGCHGHRLGLAPRRGRATAGAVAR